MFYKKLITICTVLLSVNFCTASHDQYQLVTGNQNSPTIFKGGFGYCSFHPSYMPPASNYDECLREKLLFLLTIDYNNPKQLKYTLSEILCLLCTNPPNVIHSTLAKSDYKPNHDQRLSLGDMNELAKKFLEKVLGYFFISKMYDYHRKISVQEKATNTYIEEMNKIVFDLSEPIKSYAEKNKGQIEKKVIDHFKKSGINFNKPIFSTMNEFKKNFITKCLQCGIVLTTSLFSSFFYPEGTLEKVTTLAGASSVLFVVFPSAFKICDFIVNERESNGLSRLTLEILRTVLKNIDLSK